MTTGKVLKGKRTKHLVPLLSSDNIAIIDHEDLDRISGETLAARGVKAVVNAARSVSGRYPNLGPGILLESGIPLFDDAGQAIFDDLEDGDELRIEADGSLYKSEVLIAKATIMDKARLEELLAAAELRMDTELELFVQNTIQFLDRESVALIYDPFVPQVETAIRGRQVLVVVRGYDYLDDLDALKPYIREVRPVLIGVDGGADAILEAGFRPDIIIGDMDSVSDKALLSGAEVIAHAYESGECPSAPRLEALGVPFKSWPLSATSEDLALLLAWEKKADLIVALGTHSNVVEYLDKGRSGMASSFLVRLKAGSKLVDAKGVSKLYRASPQTWHVSVVVLAALLVVGAIFMVSEPLRSALALFWLNIRAQLGI
ncbi:MAG: putative cytokinetic ring protein SteA [Coriobacteriia bacterium]|nr:putative cytokinetic ring protein SteA [Coriobacteriia bacterium]